MKILFWNTHRNSAINPYIESIVDDNNINIIVLSEYTADKQELCNRFWHSGRTEMSQYLTIGCDRITMFGNYTNVEPADQNKYYSLQIIKGKYILCATHLPSDLYGNKEAERCAIIRKIMNDIHDREARINSFKTIIVGDFNAMPYSHSCLGADTFHGLPVYEQEGNDTRKVTDIEYRKYYNPMWNLFGDFSDPPGTYYRTESSLCVPMWYMLDQFILGKEIVPFLNKEQLKIITSCAYGFLTDERGRPNIEISDHFPIMCEIIEED